jgi:hypothetical protein
MLNNDFQCAFITASLDRQFHIIGLLEQINYQRKLWVFISVISIKEIATNFWSSSPNANNSSNAWQLNFNNGNDNNNNRNNSNRVRLVRFGV